MKRTLDNSQPMSASPFIPEPKKQKTTETPSFLAAGFDQSRMKTQPETMSAHPLTLIINPKESMYLARPNNTLYPLLNSNGNPEAVIKILKPKHHLGKIENEQTILKQVSILDPCMIQVLSDDYLASRKVWDTTPKIERFRIKSQTFDWDVIETYKLPKKSKSILLEAGTSNLKELLEETNDSIFRANMLKYMSQILNQIQILSKARIAHRDVKLSNIVFFKETDQLKLIDFETACEMDEHNHNCSNAIHYTGTKEYLSPEQVLLIVQKDNSTIPCHKIDVWAAGITFIRLILNNDSIKQGQFSILLEQHITIFEQLTTWQQKALKSEESTKKLIFQAYAPFIRKTFALLSKARVDSNIITLLKKMLQLDSDSRISIEDTVIFFETKIKSNPSLINLFSSTS